MVEARCSVGTAPLEGDELARFARTVPLETERVRAIGRRAPPCSYATWTGFRAWQVVDLRHLAFAGRAHQRFGRGQDVVGRDLGSPFRKVWRDLHLDGRERETFDLALHQVAEALGPAARLAGENGLQRGALGFVGALVHENCAPEIAALPPNVAAERPQHRHVEAIELDVAVATFLNVPEEDALAEPVVRRLGP